MPTLEFKGKQHIWAHHLTVPYRPLVPVPEKSVGEPAIDGNLVVHGDNLEGLKALLPRYAGRVKCISIDPPYNTGNEGWVYNDNANGKTLQEWYKAQTPVDGEDLERHDKWLCMMWPRLQIMHELLAEDGVIFVFADDNEQHHLRAIMDEIIGEENFLACVSWEKRFTRSNNAKMFTSVTDKVLVYRKGSSVSFLREPRTEKADAIYQNPDEDPRGPWTSVSYVNPATREQRPNLAYPIVNPFTNVEVNHPTNAWKFGLDEHRRHISQRLLWWGSDGNLKYPRLKKFLSEVSDGIVPVDLWKHEDSGTTDAGSRELESILGRSVFDNPKPSRLIERIVQLAGTPDAVVLDSFAGSGTTAQAVLALNKEDGGNRKFILVECEDYADTVTAERVRRVIAGVPDAKDDALREGLGGMFTYCTLGDPITVEGMLRGDGLPEFPALAAWLLHTATGVSARTGQLRAMDEDGHFYSDDRRDYFLLYEPSVEWLQSEEAVLNEARAKRIGAGRSKEAIVFGAAKYISQQDLTAEYHITFCQLPYEIHRLR